MILTDYIKKRVLKRNKNFLGIITGETGSGKSYSAIKLAEDLDADFDIKNIVFTPKEFMDRINSDELKRGSVIIFDEAGVGINSRSWQSTSNKLLNYVLQTFRHKNYIVIFTTPNLSFIDAGARRLFHYLFETVQILENDYVQIKPFQITSTNRAKKIYYIYPTYSINGRKVKLTRCYIGLPSKKLTKEYEEKKNEYTKTMNENILRELRADEGIHQNELTDKQKLLLKYREEGLTQTKIGEIFNITQRSVSSQLATLRRRGYTT